MPKKTTKATPSEQPTVEEELTTEQLKWLSEIGNPAVSEDEYRLEGLVNHFRYYIALDAALTSALHLEPFAAQHRSRPSTVTHDMEVFMKLGQKIETRKIKGLRFYRYVPGTKPLFTVNLKPGKTKSI